MSFLKRCLDKTKGFFRFLEIKDVVFLLLVFFMVLGVIFSNNITRKGDAVEYMLTTETLLFDKSLKFTPSVMSRHKSLRPSTIDEGVYVVNAGKDGQSYLTQHPFYYSLFSLPLYGVMSLLHPKVAYYSFFITNLLYLLVAITVLIYYYKTKLKFNSYLYLVFGLVFLSAAFPYILWQHPETFVFLNVTLFFFTLYGLKKPVLSAIFLGLATGQSIVLVFLVLNLIYFLFFHGKVDPKKTAHTFAVFGIISSLHYLVSFYYTGRFFPLADYSTISILAMKDIAYEIFDPSVGLIWFYPMVILCLVFLKRELKSAVILISVFLCLLFFMINNQFYTHQVGLRYLNYVYPAFFFLLDAKKMRQKTLLFFMLLGFSGLIASGFITDITSSNSSMDPTTKNLLGYRLLTKALFPYYKEHPSVFIYHSTLLQNDLPLVNDLESFKVYAAKDGGTIYEKNGWIVNNPWSRLMMNPIKPGKVELSLVKPCNSTTYVIDNRKVTENSKKIEFEVLDSMVGHTDKRDMNAKFSDYLYLDLRSEPGCAIENIEEIRNNGRVVYFNHR